MWSLLAEFLLKLCTGEVFALWKEHKQNEAIAAQNKDASLSAPDVVTKLHSDWSRQ